MRLRIGRARPAKRSVLINGGPTTYNDFCKGFPNLQHDLMIFVDGKVHAQKCEAVPRRIMLKAHRLSYHSTLGSTA